MFGIGIQEFGLILVVALLVFGPKRLPELARMLGRGMGEFRRASNDLRQSLALDDLQNDLRRDLRSAQSLLKDDDRPAQAGDDVPTSTASTASLGETSTPERYRPAPDKHQGELPLGNDHEHHAEAAEPGTESGSESSPASESDADARAADATDSERG